MYPESCLRTFGISGEGTEDKRPATVTTVMVLTVFYHFIRMIVMVPHRAEAKLQASLCIPSAPIRFLTSLR